MKYVLGLLGILLLNTYGWAVEKQGTTPTEEMTIYATLSAPMASFWEIKTGTGEESLTMPANSQLNLGVSTGKGGTVTTNGTSDDPDTITNVWMEKGTTLKVGSNVGWSVPALKIGPKGTATINGGLIANQLNIGSSAENEITVENKMRIVPNIQAENGTFQTIDLPHIKFKSSGPNTKKNATTYEQQGRKFVAVKK